MLCYLPTAGMTEGDKVEYMAAVYNTVVLVPSWEHVSILTDTNIQIKGPGKLTIRCWAFMAKMVSTKTINYCWVLVQHLTLHLQKR